MGFGPGYPTRHCFSWNANEDHTLMVNYKSGMSIAELSAYHGRTHNGIEERIRLLSRQEQDDKRQRAKLYRHAQHSFTLDTLAGLGREAVPRDPLDTRTYEQILEDKRRRAQSTDAPNCRCVVLPIPLSTGHSTLQPNDGAPCLTGEQRLGAQNWSVLLAIYSGMGAFGSQLNASLTWLHQAGLITYPYVKNENRVSPNVGVTVKGFEYVNRLLSKGRDVQPEITPKQPAPERHKKRKAGTEAAPGSQAQLADDTFYLVASGATVRGSYRDSLVLRKPGTMVRESVGEALGEAQRLAELNVGERFFVLKAISSLKAEESQVVQRSTVTNASNY
jgi:hypothetical protein